MTRQIIVGGIPIGGGAPVVIQSMLNTKTTDVEGSLSQIRALAAAGCRDAVRVTLGDEEYPTRTYEQLAFPAGEYLSLRVLIGAAEGENWWCVLFPPLCLSAATSEEEAETAFLALFVNLAKISIFTPP